jgi:hypothetical protein
MLMETLGDDLILLAIRPSGAIAALGMLKYGLSGSELVRLAALRRIDIENGRITVLDTASTGDVLLDEALAYIHRDWQEPTAKEWILHYRGELVRRYLERLAAAGTLQLERRKALGFTTRDNGWTVVDAGRLAAARARLDAIAHGTGPVDMTQAALAGLAAAIGLPPFIYPRFGGRAARRRIARVALSGDSSAQMTQAVGAGAVGTLDPAMRATGAAVRAVNDAMAVAARAGIAATTYATLSTTNSG